MRTVAIGRYALFLASFLFPLSFDRKLSVESESGSGGLKTTAPPHHHKLHDSRSVFHEVFFILGLDDFFSNRVNVLTSVHRARALRFDIPLVWCSIYIITVQVEELASLVEDNFPCKYLVLSVEDMLVNYLQDDDTSLDGVLELEPMNSYNRLLVHRLAEIFGFSHYSVGEGEDRHLVLERSPETSIPGILVSDLLSQYGEMQSPMTYDVLRRKEVFPGQKVGAVSGPSLDERETAYFAARQRIFSEDACDSKLLKERPKKDPVVARRMITRALGQADKGTIHELTSSDTKEFGRTAVEDVKMKYMDERNCHSSNKMETKPLSGKNSRACTMLKVNKSKESEVVDGLSKEVRQKNDLQGGESSAEMKTGTRDNYLRQEQMGAAKRLFANALGMHRRDINLSKSHETKKTGC